MRWEEGRVTLAVSWDFDGCYVETSDGEILRIEPNEVVLPFEMDHLFDGTRRVDAEMEIRVRAGTPVQMMGVVRRADYREAPPPKASGGPEATGTISGRVSVEMGASLR